MFLLAVQTLFMMKYVLDTPHYKHTLHSSLPLLFMQQV